MQILSWKIVCSTRFVFITKFFGMQYFLFSLLVVLVQDKNNNFSEELQSVSQQQFVSQEFKVKSHVQLPNVDAVVSRGNGDSLTFVQSILYVSEYAIEKKANSSVNINIVYILLI